MTENLLLDKVKTALGITGTFQDGTLTLYIDEVIAYLVGAGVHSAIAKSSAAVGVIARGVSDLWNYGNSGGKLSQYFKERVIQLSYIGIDDEFATGTVRVAVITLLASAWKGSDGTYSQIVNIEDVTDKSRVDLQPTPEQLAILLEEETTLTAVNDESVITVFAIGRKPKVNYEMQITITEVDDDE